MTNETKSNIEREERMKSLVGLINYNYEIISYYTKKINAILCLKDYVTDCDLKDIEDIRSKIVECKLELDGYIQNYAKLI